MRREGLFLLLSLLTAGLSADLREHPQPAIYQIEDPVEAALSKAADGDLGKARAELERACAATPNDAEAWAALAVVYGELKLPREVKRCERHVLAVDKAQGKAVLATRRSSYQAMKAEVLAEKEERGDRALPVQRPLPTPDPKVWSRLEKERGKDHPRPHLKPLEEEARMPKAKSRGR